MLNKIKLALSLLDSRSKFFVLFFSMLRILIAGLDTLGVVLIGLLLTKSTNQLLADNPESSGGILSSVNFINDFSLSQIAGAALLLFVSKSILAAIFTKKMAMLLAVAESRVASQTFNKLLNGGFQNFSSISNQDLVFSLNYSATSAISNMISITVAIISELTLLIAIAILFMYIDFEIATGIIFYFSIIGFFIYKLIGPEMQNLGKKYADSASRSSAALFDSVVAYRELYTLNKQSEFSAKFSNGRVGFAKSNAYASFYSGLPRYIVETALIVGAAILALYVFKKNDPAVAAGILGIFLTGSVRIMASMLPLQTSLNSLRQTMGVSEPFFNLVQISKDAIDTLDKSRIATEQAVKPISIEFKNVSFSYPSSDSPVIKNVSLDIKAGEYVALIGPSGSGKSTIADLLIKLAQPTLGSVTFTNVDTSEARIGYVPQSPGIVSGTILENITLNVDTGEFDQQWLNKALQGAHLTDLINSLKSGVNTDLGAQLDGLSGGQMQRIGLARALYSNPGLLVLDEATSALDAETESAISNSLRELKGRCTIVVIAHRLSTVQNADRVFVIEDGEISASGKFNELARTNKLVSRYVELSKLSFE